MSDQGIDMDANEQAADSQGAMQEVLARPIGTLAEGQTFAQLFRAGQTEVPDDTEAKMEEFYSRLDAGEAFHHTMSIGTEHVPADRTIPAVWHDLLTVRFMAQTIDLYDETGNLKQVGVEAILERNFPTTFYVTPAGRIGCFMGEYWIEVGRENGIPDPEGEEIRQKIEARNKSFNINPPNAGSFLQEDSTPQKPRTLPTIPPKGLAVLTDLTHRAAYSMMGNEPFFPAEPGHDAILTKEKKGAQIRIDCDTSIGWTPELACQKMLKFGPSIVQTHAALIALHEHDCKGMPYPTDITTNVSRVLRIKGRKEKPNGGYSREDIEECGQEIFLLRGAEIRARAVRWDEKKKTNVEYIRHMRLMDISWVEEQRPLNRTDAPPMIYFNYHVTRDTYDLLNGSEVEYAPIQLLQYHSKNQPYHILFGFALLCDKRTNRNNEKLQAGIRSIPLTTLLDMACVPLPDRNIPIHLDRFGRALSTLATDEVIPGLSLVLPKNKQTLSARAQMKAARVVYDVNLKPVLKQANTGGLPLLV